MSTLARKNTKSSNSTPQPIDSEDFSNSGSILEDYSMGEMSVSAISDTSLKSDSPFFSNLNNASPHNRPSKIQMSNPISPRSPPSTPPSKLAAKKSGIPPIQSSLKSPSKIPTNPSLKTGLLGTKPGAKSVAPAAKDKLKKPAAPEMPKIPINSVVQVPSMSLKGTLRYLGTIDGKPGLWAGIELFERGTGKNDGTVAG
jgi:hypothetical protein